MTEQMTPDQARAMLDGTTPGPWIPSRSGYIGSAAGVMIHDGHVLGDTDADTCLIAAAPTLAAMIAGMRAEYAVQVLRSGGWQYSRGEDDFRWQDLPVQMVRADRDHPGEETRIVRRYVTTPEEA